MEFKKCFLYKAIPTNTNEPSSQHGQKLLKNTKTEK